jgi:hypothetical protein
LALGPDADAQRTARIDKLLEELRLNIQDLHELSKEAVERAKAATQDAKQVTERSKAQRERRRQRRPAKS